MSLEGCPHGPIPRPGVETAEACEQCGEVAADDRIETAQQDLVRVVDGLIERGATLDSALATVAHAVTSASNELRLRVGERVAVDFEQDGERRRAELAIEGEEIDPSLGALVRGRLHFVTEKGAPVAWGPVWGRPDGPIGFYLAWGGRERRFTFLTDGSESVLVEGS